MMQAGKPPPVSNHHRYRKVPVQPESDSEDDEATLYAAASLNEHSISQTDNSFGIGVYDHSRDLDLPRIRTLPLKEQNVKKRYSNWRRLLLIILVTVCLLVVMLLLAAFVIVQNNRHLPSSSPPPCLTAPKPLPNWKVQPCTNSTSAPATTQATETTPSQPQTLSTTTAPTTTTTSSKGSTGVPQGGSISSPSHTESIQTSSNKAQVLNGKASNSDATPTTEAPSKAPHEQTSTLPTTRPSDANPVTKSDNSDKDVFATTSAPPTDLEPAPSCFPVPKPLPDMQIQPCSTSTPIPKSTTSNGRSENAPTTPSVQLDTSSSSQTNKEDPSGLSVTKPEHKDTENPKTSPSQPAGNKSTPKKPLWWNRTLSPGVTESSPLLYDLNRDGIEDVVVVQDFSQCVVKIVALSGADGTPVWEKNVQFPVFAVRCILDANSDDVMDCVVTGRTGGFIVIDGARGNLVWAVDRTIVFPSYNFFYPVVVADMNGDGVEDLVNTHGGDSVYEPYEHNRSPGFMVAVSGRTGEKLMESILMPDGHETYMSPVLFAVNQTNQFILFGSGGETIPGSLWAIELESLRNRVKLHLDRSAAANVTYQINTTDNFHSCFLKSSFVERMRPVFNHSKFNLTQSVEGNCPTLADKKALKNDYNVCLYEIARSETKGVILPPVIVDMTLDGVEDLVVSLYNGTTLILDGRDISTVVWAVHYPGTESYSLPAPLHYTSDDIPDLVIRTNVGAWAEYNISTIIVLDGSNGSLLWKFDSTHSGMMSAVTVISKTRGQDALVFVAIGATKPDEFDPRKRAVHRGTRDMGKGGGGGEEEEEEGAEFGEAEEEGNHPMGSFNFSMAPKLDPPDLWVSTDDDPVPDPRDLDAFLKYCKHTRSELTTSVYMVTREMMESGMEVLPLASYEPYIALLSYPNSTHSPRRSISLNKRHGPSAQSPKGGKEEEDDNDNDFHTDQADIDDATLKREHRIDLRCKHISAPVYMYTTPLMGDFDGDGRLDMAYVVVWSATGAAVSKMLVVASTLEKLFTNAYGTEILDFDNFLAPSEQPWTQYMGRRGDNVFATPKT